MRLARIAIFALMAFLVVGSACAGPGKETSSRVPAGAGRPYELLQRGLAGYTGGQFSEAAVIFDRLLEFAAARDSQLAFLGVYYGIRCRLATGASAAADSLYDSHSRFIPEGQRQELELLLGRLAQAGTQSSLAVTEARPADKLSVVLPLSGKFSEFGEAILQGVELAAKQFNQDRDPASQIKLEVRDDQSDPVKAAALGRILVADSTVAAVIGSFENETTLALALVCAAVGVPVICPTADAPGLDNLGPQVHVLNRTDPDLARSLAQFAVDELKIHTFAILAADDERGNLLAAAFAREVHGRGGVILSNQRYTSQTSTFENQLNLLQRYLPDGLFLSAKSNEITQLASQVHYYGLSGIQLLGLEYWDSERVIRLGGDYVDQAVFTSAFYQDGEGLSWNEFKNLYESAYRRPVNRYSAYGYDAANLALEAAGVLPASRETLSRRLNGISGYPGAMANYSLDNSGLVRKKVFILQLSRGEIVPARPPDFPGEAPEVPPSAVSPGDSTPSTPQ